MRHRVRLLTLLGLFALALWVLNLCLHLSMLIETPWELSGSFYRTLVVWLGWRTTFAALGLDLAVLFVLLARPAELRLVDAVVASFVLSNVLFDAALAFAVHGFSPYSGAKLLIVGARSVLFWLLGLAAVWGLYAGRLWARLPLVAAVAMWFLSVAWYVEPNSSRCLEYRRELAAAPAESIAEDASVSILKYPSWMHYLSYYGIALYLPVRHRRRSKIQSTRPGEDRRHRAGPEML